MGGTYAYKKVCTQYNNLTSLLFRKKGKLKFLVPGPYFYNTEHYKQSALIQYQLAWKTVYSYSVITHTAPSNEIFWQCKQNCSVLSTFNCSSQFHPYAAVCNYHHLPHKFSSFPNSCCSNDGSSFAFGSMWYVQTFQINILPPSSGCVICVMWMLKWRHSRKCVSHT